MCVCVLLCRFSCCELGASVWLSWRCQHVHPQSRQDSQVWLLSIEDISVDGSITQFLRVAGQWFVQNYSLSALLYLSSVAGLTLDFFSQEFIIWISSPRIPKSNINEHIYHVVQISWELGKSSNEVDVPKGWFGKLIWHGRLLFSLSMNLAKTSVLSQKKRGKLQMADDQP